MTLPSPSSDSAAAPAARVLLVGNPNVGKSVLFGRLTGRYVTVSNFPGTTVEVARARGELGGRSVEVVDTPGVNDLHGAGGEARATAEILERDVGATVVQVADAKNLRRALLLTLQLAERGRRVVLVLNMMDELERRGGRIDVERLAERLGVPVVPAVAIDGRGVEEIASALVAPVAPRIDRRLLARRGEEGYEANRRRLETAGEIVAEVLSLAPPASPSWGVRLGFWAMDPIRGLALLGVVLYGMFWAVGLFGAGTAVDLLEVGLFEQRLAPAAIGVVDRLLPFPHEHLEEEVAAEMALPLSPVHGVALGRLARRVERPAYRELAPPPGEPTGWGVVARRGVHDFLVGEYGMLTMALPYALAIVLPIVFSFFLLFSLLEDSGYLPRMAILVHRVFRWMGLDGKAVLPMILGLGCATMATVTTRILETRRDRLVTTLLLALAVPCSAQLGVLLALVSRISPLAAALWVAMMVAVLLAVGWMTARILGGEGSSMVLELPPMRRPVLSNVVAKTSARVRWYLLEVIPLFVLATACLFVLDRWGALESIAGLGRPLVEGWLGLPAETAQAFLVGFLRRDFGAVYLLDAALGRDPLLDAHQVFVAIVTITLFMPCLATLLMIGREHGRRVALAMASFIFPFAFLVGGLMHRVGMWLGI